MWLGSEIENPAIRAYHNDPKDEDEYQGVGQDMSTGPTAAYGETGIQMRTFNSSEMFEGGIDDG